MAAKHVDATAEATESEAVELTGEPPKHGFFTRLYTGTGAVDVIGMIPPSTKPNVDDAVFGAACWDRWDPKADRFSIYVRGLSDGYVEVLAESGGKPVVKYKTLRIDFIRRGDEHHLNEKEIQLADPPYTWVYW